MPLGEGMIDFFFNLWALRDRNIARFGATRPLRASHGIPSSTVGISDARRSGQGLSTPNLGPAEDLKNLLRLFLRKNLEG